MTQLRPYVRPPLACRPLGKLLAAAPPARFCLTVNGVSDGFAGTEASRRTALACEALRLMRAGWQVPILMPDFARIWRHAPAEMRELRVEATE